MDSPADAMRLASDLGARARAAVAAGDAGRLTAALDHAFAAGDPDVRLAVALAVATPPPDGAAGLAAARAAVRDLEAAPLEPLRWAALAGQLAALGEGAAAAGCAAAAERLEPGTATGHAAAPEPAAGQASEAAALGARAAALAAAVAAPPPGRLSVAMIARDEGAMLAACLASVGDVADEIVVADTGSRDETVEVARAAGATVVEVPWNDSFAEARNASLDRVSGDWVLWLDADERVDERDLPALRALLARPWRRAFRLPMTHLTGAGGTGPPFVTTLMRLWRHAPGVRFEGRVHEQVTGLPDWLDGRSADAPVRLVHHGYVTELAEARGKRRRNLELLAGDEDDRPLHRAFRAFNTGTEHLVAGNARAAREALDASARELRGLAPGSRVPWRPALWLRLATACRLTGDLPAARRVAAEGLEALPDHTDLVVERALTDAAAGDHAAALAGIDAAIAMGDGPPAYASTVGIDGPVGLELRGRLLAALGRHADAATSFAQALRRGAAPEAALDPALAAAAAWHGALAEGDGSAPTAEQVPPLLDLLAAAMAAERFADVDRLYALIARADVDPAERGHLLAERFLAAGFTDLAAEHWTPLAGAVPPDARGLAGLAQVALAQGLATEARDLAAAALEADPANAVAAAILGRAPGQAR